MTEPSRLRRATGPLGAILIATASPGFGQEPIFVTPPVTMYQFGAVAGVDVEPEGNGRCFVGGGFRRAGSLDRLSPRGGH